MSKPTDQIKKYWTAASQKPRRRSLPVAGQQPPGEFPVDANTLVIEGGASRRKFMGILGASAAIAGVTSTGCIRKPVERIMPFAVRPEDMVPGVAVHYATGYQIGDNVIGLLVESIDGRPIKVEGNPRHPGSRGGTDGYAQASVLNLYDPDRSMLPKSKVLAGVDSGEGSSEVRKARIVERLAKETYERILKQSKSIDAARKARDEVKSQAESATAREVKGDKGSGIELRISAKNVVESDWATTWTLFDELAGELAAAKGAKFGVVLPQSSSPTLHYLVEQFRSQFPLAKIFAEDSSPGAVGAAVIEAFAGKNTSARYSLEGAEVIFTADCDFLGSGADHTRLTHEWAKMRKADEKMSRTYAAEAQMSVTGGAADHRIQARSAEIPLLLAALVRELIDVHKRAVPAGADALAAAVKAPQLDAKSKQFIKALAKDMVARADKSVVLVGQRQPAGAHALGLLVNGLLGSLGGESSGLQRLRAGSMRLAAPGLEALAASLQQGEIETLLCIGTNPAYYAPASLKMGEALQKAKQLVHSGLFFDETARLASMHMPCSHYLEAWGDLECNEGTKNICQPLIAPLYDTPSNLEIFARLLRPGKESKGYELVKGYWAHALGSAQKRDQHWNTWLNQGVVSGEAESAPVETSKKWSDLVASLRALPAPNGEGMEINFYVDGNMHVGEFANNAWMQECPRIVSKLVWDNAALISLATSKKLKVKNGDMLSIKVGERSLSIPAWISYGQRDDTVAITLGQGRDIGNVSEGAGFNANLLRSHRAPTFEQGDVSRGTGRYELVTTQDYGLLDPDGADGIGFLNYPERAIYRESNVEGFKKDPHFAKQPDLIKSRDRLEPLWERPKLDGINQWGMSIDLNRCVGCNACQLACQAENNIPVVGKKECANGREMHWVRMDRYYRGDLDNPEMVLMPVSCMHCETAPCENVCPVQATAHSPEGLNDMAYNRCVGTRYCANNCPYKVRRFNFFNYNKNLPEVIKMSKNPDVTVRFRGVIEKCTYCVQRINAAKIRVHVRDESLVKDKDLKVACEQVCATNAIAFGNLNDKDSRVVKEKASPRTYSLLGDLGTLPRTTFQARVRNPNPELA